MESRAYQTLSSLQHPDPFLSLLSKLSGEWGFDWQNTARLYHIPTIKRENMTSGYDLLDYFRMEGVFSKNNLSPLSQLVPKGLHPLIQAYQQSQTSHQFISKEAFVQQLQGQFDCLPNTLVLLGLDPCVRCDMQRLALLPSLDLLYNLLVQKASSDQAYAVKIQSVLLQQHGLQILQLTVAEPSPLLPSPPSTMAFQDISPHVTGYAAIAAVAVSSSVSIPIPKPIKRTMVNCSMIAQQLPIDFYFWFPTEGSIVKEKRALAYQAVKKKGAKFSPADVHAEVPTSNLQLIKRLRTLFRMTDNSSADDICIKELQRLYIFFDCELHVQRAIRNWILDKKKEKDARQQEQDSSNDRDRMNVFSDSDDQDNDEEY